MPTDPKDESKLEDLLDKRQQIDEVFKQKFTRRVTVMFTDLKGSTSIAEREGDLSSRLVMKEHNSIVMPAISGENGVLVKTMGDGTLSYFERAQDALRAAAKIQSGIDAFNLSGKLKSPILVRIGLHTGQCIVEENDIFGDVVNSASRYESLANPGEIYLSKETFDSIDDKDEIYCRFIKKATLKGKEGQADVYKAYWNKEEVKRDLEAEKSRIPAQSGVNKWVLAGIAVAIIIIIAVLTQWTRITGSTSGETRSYEHSVEPKKQ